MSESNGEPDASKPGVPQNPERDGWHWLDDCVREWDAKEQCWYNFAGDLVLPDEYAHLRYLGPCLTPAEVAAREAAAARVDRESWIKHAASYLLQKMPPTFEREQAFTLLINLAEAPCQLPVTTTSDDALARLLAEAEARGREAEREACAQMVATWPAGITTQAQQDIAAAIRAGKETTNAEV